MSPSTVQFPVSEPPSPTKHVQSPPYLPFRRISLPAAPSHNMLHRQSVVSVASFDSLPEDSSSSSPFPTPGHRMSISIESPRRRRRSKAVPTMNLTPVDETRETKRRKVVEEFMETERAYVDGLELVHEHFLTPIIVSSSPILDRAQLTAVFSNFIDIWNLHRALFASLVSLPSSSSLSSVLAEHFPYLSLYTPFTTSFPTTLATLADLTTSSSTSYNPAFTAFLTAQESDPRCGKLKLRDWLLTIIQRCPRYLLLLADLISCTDPGHAEHAELVRVHGLVAKITGTLNASLHSHAQTLALLALQRATTNLPSALRLVVPGRVLRRREPLWMLDQEGGGPVSREVLLFSDCLVWLEETALGWGRAEGTGGRDVVSPAGGGRPEHEKRTWVYRGHVELVDVEVVGGVENAVVKERTRGWKFEVLSPQGSFVLFADSPTSRTAWTTAIRTAKAELLADLGKTRPHSTLASSASSVHVRRSVRAVAFLPDDEDEDNVNAEGGGTCRRESDCGTRPLESGATRMTRTRDGGTRRSVEHFVPAVWMPDDKAGGCVRCGRAFGWRRRRHHCRLCGGVVCAGCSGKTFYISETEPLGGGGDDDHAHSPGSPRKAGKQKEKQMKDKYKPARACEACYEAVFPVIPAVDRDGAPFPSPGRPVQSNPNGEERNENTITSLKDLPMWVNVGVTLPSLESGLGLGKGMDGAVSLMKVGVGGGAGAGDRRAKRGSGSGSGSGSGVGSGVGSGYGFMERPRSCVDVVEGETVSCSPEGKSGVEVEVAMVREDTARRVKRFSLPAGVALQRTSVNVFSAGQEEGDVFGGGVASASVDVLKAVERNDGPVAEGQRRIRRTSLVGATRVAAGRRFSLVLRDSQSLQSGVNYGAGGEGKREVGALGKGSAAGKLGELLGRN